MELVLSQDDISRAFKGFKVFFGRNSKNDGKSLVRFYCVNGETSMIAMDGVNSLVFKVETPENADFYAVFNWLDIKWIMVDKRKGDVAFVINDDAPDKARIKRGHAPGIEWIQVVGGYESLEFNDPEIMISSDDDFSVKLNKVIKFSEKDGVRQAFGGALIEPGWIVASDGKRLVRLPINLDLKQSVIAPKHSVIEASILAGSGEIGVYDESKRIVIKAGQWRFDVGLIDATYPDYRGVIPNRETLPKRVVFTSNTIKRLTEIIKRKQTKRKDDIYPVYIVFKGKRVVIIYHNKDNPIVFETEADFVADDGETISIDKRILLEVFGMEFGTILFKDATSPMLAYGDIEVDMAFMPLTNPEPEVVARIVAEAKNALANNEKRKDEKMVDETKVAFKERESNDDIVDFDGLIEFVTEMKRSLNTVKGMVNALPAKVREVHRNVKAKERAYENARDAIKQLRNVSGF